MITPEPNLTLCGPEGAVLCAGWAHEVAGSDGVAVCNYAAARATCVRASVCWSSERCLCGAEAACAGSAFCVIDADGTPRCVSSCRP